MIAHLDSSCMTLLFINTQFSLQLLARPKQKQFYPTVINSINKIFTLLIYATILFVLFDVKIAIRGKKIQQNELKTFVHIRAGSYWN